MPFARGAQARRYRIGEPRWPGEGRLFNGSPSRGLSRINTSGPGAHRLPFYVIWGITLLTAVSMALINFCQIWVISFIVQWKFNSMQVMIDRLGVGFGVFTLALICASLATVCTCLVFFVAPSCGSSGAPENKGWLNGSSIPGLFTSRNLVTRGLATMLANTAGYPVGREGPTVTMGSNIAYLITHWLALPYVRQWVNVNNTLGSGCSPALMIDEERFAHAKRIVCTVGGACGMAMLFDSPIGGIVYMFEEITAASWPLEVTFRAFAGTSVCTLLSRALLNLCNTTTKAFVVYEWNPQPQPWTWSDVPWFMLLAVLLGPFSAFHTRACLAVGTGRQRLMGMFPSWQPGLKMADAIFYSIVCALTYALVALCAKCMTLPGSDAVEFVRYDCEEGQYNPVASLLLTTSEGAVKRLFSRKNVDQIHAKNELLAFIAYTTLNVVLTGVPVPSGNFTGSMLIGGLAGRMVGAVVRDYGGQGEIAVSGVYAMVGSAAMLCGFKQMAVAVVVFITGCANDPNLIPPLMLSITISLILNQLCNERGFDEEQILRKSIPFLPPEAPKGLDRAVAHDLCDMLPQQAVLPEQAPVRLVRDALAQSEVCDFPVLRDGRICIGFTTRARLEAAMASMEAGELEGPHMRASSVHDEDGEELLGRTISASFGRQSSLGGGTLLPVSRLAERSPYTLLEDMPAERLYPLFAKAGVRAACVVSESGEFRGMITRAGLILQTRRMWAQGTEEFPPSEDEDCVAESPDASTEMEDRRLIAPQEPA